MTNKWIKNINWNGTIKIISGLHIGGSKESIKIGGTDAPVITTKILYEDKREIEIPYIPGSSIKGKMRYLLETAYEGNPKKDNILKLFGKDINDKSNTNNIITRLLIRDAFPTKEWIDKVAKNEDITEIKGENQIDRLNSIANPRFIERVLPDVKFDLQFIIRIYENDDEKVFLDLLKEGIKFLEDSYLGGQGSRGYGKIKIEMSTSVIEKNLEKYES